MIKNEELKKILAYISLFLLAMLITLLVAFGVINKSMREENNNNKSNTNNTTNQDTFNKEYNMNITITNGIETNTYNSIIDTKKNIYKYYDMNNNEIPINTNINIYLLLKSLINSDIDNYKIDILLDAYLLSNLKEYFNTLGYTITPDVLSITIEGNKDINNDIFKAYFTSDNLEYTLSFSPYKDNLKEVQ